MPKPKRSSAHHSTKSTKRAKGPNGSSSSSSRAKDKGIVVDQDGDEIYYKVDSVVGYRWNNKSENWEYLVRWEGCSEAENTWEPEDCLCDSSLVDAVAFRTRQQAEGARKSVPETKSDDGHVLDEDDRKMPAREAEEPEEEEIFVDDGGPDWSDKGQISYREIERVSVDDPLAAERVRDARLNGVPVVLTDHKGWTQFAKKWLEPILEPPPGTSDTTQEEDPAEEQHPVAGVVGRNESETTDPEHQSPRTVAVAVAQLHEGEESTGSSPVSQLAAKENRIEPILTLPAGGTEVLHQKEEALPDRQNTVAPKPRRAMNPHKAIPSLPEHRSTIDLTRAGRREWDSAGETASERRLFDHENAGSSSSSEKDLLDLAKPHQLCLESLLDDIGSEKVPILRRLYERRDPNKQKIHMETFIRECWAPGDRGEGETMEDSDKSEFYLHQWQFPMSKTAAKKLCGPGANKPIPNDIIGEELLRYWYKNDERHSWNNPYQYLFMGRDGTMSRLHRDNGGLAITIAPIVGEKEVLLVHRADGPTSLYHLAANVDEPDLNKYPMLFTARVWKTVVRPGEILLMPQGTYHQCRNVTPCLSYHRFILDECNLKPFLESFFDEDATEIDHDAILWNASYELHTEVDHYVKEAKDQWLETGQVKTWDEVPSRIARAIQTLRKLRNISREIEFRHLGTDHPDHTEWKKMVGDIDGTLHRFKHRYSVKVPRRVRMERTEHAVEIHEPPTLGAESEGEIHEQEATSKAYQLEQQFSRLPKLESEEACSVIPDSVIIQVDDRVIAKVHGRRLIGTISEIREHMMAAFIEYEDFAAEFHCEFMPMDRLGIMVDGDSIFGVPTNTDLAAGTVVYYCTENGGRYRAKVKSCRRGTLYLVSLELNNGQQIVERWLTRESFLSKMSVATATQDEEGGCR